MQNIILRHYFVGKVHVLLIIILFLLISSWHFSSYHHGLCKTLIYASKFTAKTHALLTILFL
jgi:hypothetical protein